ncbi:oxidoreductase [Fulvitalea axinellae]|uniref:Oxidoreductase n=1 Tax=Fulvitalea axinellae TaxID=1182444 RepID=A0AAU9CJ19_9BACT|nr:oxidoreductase [Fulvitalea axinellae]
MHISFENKRALVCGGTDGIGKAVAVAMAEAGAEVIIFARDEKKLADTIASLPAEQGQKHGFLVADFYQPAQVSKALAENLGDTAIDIVVNNTGGPAPGTTLSASPDAFIHAFEAHLVCNQLIAQHVAQGMTERRFGRFINIISYSVKTPIANLGVSNTIRGAVASWAKSLSNELAPYGITVNNVLPGLTETERLFALITKRAEESGLDYDEKAEKMKKEIPAKRFAKPEETANAVLFFASEQAAYITGTNLPVDGGLIPSI